MVVFNRAEAEEPVPCTGHLCRLEGLEVRTVMLDEIMAAPGTPERCGSILYKHTFVCSSVHSSDEDGGYFVVV